MQYAHEIGYESEPNLHAVEQHLQPFEDALEYLRAYARERPEVMALTCFGIGFILGWKLKPW
jgi:hypothetical protein